MNATFLTVLSRFGCFFRQKIDESCKLWLQTLHTAKKDEGNWLRRSEIATVFVITAKRGCAADSRCSSTRVLLQLELGRGDKEAPQQAVA